MCDGGQAWKRNQQGILDHAIDLGYDRIAPLPSLSADKRTWTSWADKFNAWKRSGMPMPTVEESGGGGDSGGGRGLIETGDGLGPYPAYNKYFPMLTTAYEAPGFQDFSAYMTPGVFSGNNGALYQPWAGREFSYTPPEFNVGPVQYYAPVNPLEIVFEEEMSEDPSSGTNSSDGLTDLDMRGGKGPGDIGYGTNSPSDPNAGWGGGYGDPAVAEGDHTGTSGSETFGLGESESVGPSAEWGGGHTSGKGKGPTGGGFWG
jgi:hypothetical protein